MKITRTYIQEVNNEPSCTDPSQNIELRTIVDRFVKGLPIPTVGRVLTPDDFDDVDNNSCPPDALDLSEVKDLVDRANDTVASLISGERRMSSQGSDDAGGTDRTKEDADEVKSSPSTDRK